MYRGYSISKTVLDYFFYEIGRKNADCIDPFYLKHKEKVEENMEKIFLRMEEDVLDAEIIQKDWFPEINTDVFISHSHVDIDLAKNFSGWLYNQFGITSFIDSCVWGYADDLLHKIDDEYCRKEGTKNFDYKKRNYSTAHVHMMLMTALNKMIDKSECVFFLNTPNSNVGDAIKSMTLSPWIYGEIEISRLIEKKEPKRKKLVRKYSQGGKIEPLNESKKLQMKYPLDMGHFYSLSSEKLKEWGDADQHPLNALDTLYMITPKK